MSLRKVSALTVGLALGVAVVMIGTSLSELGTARSPSRADNDGDEVLVGKDFAESLSLPVIDELKGCTHAAEAPPDETLYCLDPAVDNDLEARLVGIRVTGRMPTASDERLFELERELASTPDTPENQLTRGSLAREIVDLMAEITSTGE